MIYAALFPCDRLGSSSELFGYAVQLNDVIRKFNRSMREHGTRKLIFEERCTILFDNVVARWSPGVDHMLRSECDLVPLAQRQVLGNARITVENSEITRFRPGLDD